MLQMKHRSDEIAPQLFPELTFLLRQKISRITPEIAFRTYEREWRWVNYQMMSNVERMFLIELIDEIGGGVFEPFLDKFGKARERVVIEVDESAR